MEKKQLATEWLMEQLYNNEKLFMSGNGNVLDELLAEAKTKEVYEIMDSFELGHANGYDCAQGIKEEYENGADYYNKTFKPE